MNKNERLFEAIGEVGEDLICEAEWHHFTSPWRKWSGAVAAMLALVLTFAMVLPLVRGGRKSYESAPAAPQDVDVGKAENEMPTEEIVEAPAEEAPMEEPAGTPEPEEEDPFADNPEDTDEIDPEEPEEEVVEDFYGDLFPVETEADFWKLFPELDMQSMVDYMDTHPGIAENGWPQVVVSQPGYNEEGKRCYEETGILTTNGDQVLVIDVPNRILLVRVRDESAGYRGVLAFAKDPCRLNIGAGENYGADGNLVGDIAADYDGVLAMNASMTLGLDGERDGVPVGYFMSDGRILNGVSSPENQQLELDEDNRMSLAKAGQPVDPTITDAVEVYSALISNGEILKEQLEFSKNLSPRSCIAQRENGEILMLVVEGRLENYSYGTDLLTCARILQDYGADLAVALDYGTSAILWYDGQYVTKCSNEDWPEGRKLPNAFVYSRKGS